LLEPMFAHLNAASNGIRLHPLLVDNASTDGSVAWLRDQFPGAHMIFNEANVGFGRANNQLLPYLSGRYVLLLNTDAFIAPDTLRRTVAYMNAHADCGVLGVRLVGRNGALQPSCRYFPTPWNLFVARAGLSRWLPVRRPIDDMAWDHASVRECDWVPGCYYLVRREVLDQLGLFDPRFFLYCEEVDHCRRVKAAGWKVVFYPDTTVVHIGGESAQTVGALSAAGRQVSDLQVESELLYFRKHYGWAGLWFHLALTLIGDIYLSMKDVIKGRGRQVFQHVQHLRLTWGLCRRTQWATVPTR